MVYLPTGIPVMALSLPLAAAGIAAASKSGLTGLLLLLGGVGEATTHIGLLGIDLRDVRGRSRVSRTSQPPIAASSPLCPLRAAATRPR
jgi:hypothetical protein